MGGGTPVLRDFAKISVLEHTGFIWAEVVVLWPVGRSFPEMPHPCPWAFFQGEKIQAAYRQRKSAVAGLAPAAADFLVL